MEGVQGDPKKATFLGISRGGVYPPLVSLITRLGQQNRGEATLCALTLSLKKPKKFQEAALQVLFHLLILGPLSPPPSE